MWNMFIFRCSCGQFPCSRRCKGDSQETYCLRGRVLCLHLLSDLKTHGLVVMADNLKSSSSKYYNWVSVFQYNFMKCASYKYPSKWISGQMVSTHGFDFSLSFFCLYVWQWIPGTKKLGIKLDWKHLTQNLL